MPEKNISSVAALITYINYNTTHNVCQKRVKNRNWKTQEKKSQVNA